MMTQATYVKLLKKFKPFSRNYIARTAFMKSAIGFRIALWCELTAALASFATFWWLGRTKQEFLVAVVFSIATPLTLRASIKSAFPEYHAKFFEIIQCFVLNYKGLRSRLYLETLRKEKYSKRDIERGLIIVEDEIDNCSSSAWGNNFTGMLTGAAIAIFGTLSTKVSNEILGSWLIGILFALFFMSILPDLFRSKVAVLKELRSCLLYAKMEMEDEEESLPPRLSLVQAPASAITQMPAQNTPSK